MPINGMKVWLCRAIDANEIVVDILIHFRRNAKAVKRFFADLMTTYGRPRVAITDKLRGYAKPIEVSVVRARIEAVGAKTAFSEPGSPWEMDTSKYG